MNPVNVVGGMMKDAATSAIGMVGKAQLTFNAKSGSEDNTLALNQVAVDNARDALKNKGGKLNNFKAGRIKDAPGLSTTGEHIFQVQYNPASISFQANAQSIPFQMLQDNINPNIPNQLQRDPSVVMSVELIFDDMNPVDAFMVDKFMLLQGGSVGNLVSIGAGVVNAARGKVYSVQKQTNAILAAAIRDTTRTVTFRWANMSFTGELTEVNASYTMFSVSGRPVRSTVRLSITQQIDAAGSAYWDKAFDTAFGTSATTGQKGGRGLANKSGNLINFNF